MAGVEAEHSEDLVRLRDVAFAEKDSALPNEGEPEVVRTAGCALDTEAV